MNVARYEALTVGPEAALSPDDLLSLRYYSIYIALRENPLAFPDERDRFVKWTRRALELEAAFSRTTHYPVENNRRPTSPAAAAEQSLAAWHRYQRRTETRHSHCGFQRDWLWHMPRNHGHNRDSQWVLQKREYRRFLLERGRAPRYRSDDSSEKRLAAWASKQRMRYRAENLTPKQVSELEAMTMWSWGAPVAQSAQYRAKIRLLGWGEPTPFLGPSQVDLSQLIVIVPVPPWPPSRNDGKGGVS
jgi:hypothetical protein